MARFAAPLPRLLRSSRRPALPLHGVPSRHIVLPGGEARRGPGWFDSSWELLRGLDVREGLPGDLRLNEWLVTFCFEPQRGASDRSCATAAPSSITASA